MYYHKTQSTIFSWNSLNNFYYSICLPTKISWILVKMITSSWKPLLCRSKWFLLWVYRLSLDCFVLLYWWSYCDERGIRRLLPQLTTLDKCVKQCTFILIRVKNIHKQRGCSIYIVLWIYFNACEDYDDAPHCFDKYIYLINGQKEVLNVLKIARSFSAFSAIGDLSNPDSEKLRTN